MAMIDTARTAPMGAVATFRTATFVRQAACTVVAGIQRRLAARALADDLTRLPTARLADIGMTEADVISYRARSGLI